MCWQHKRKKYKDYEEKKTDTFAGGWSSSSVSSGPVDELSIYSLAELTGTVGFFLGFERFWDLLDFF